MIKFNLTIYIYIYILYVYIFASVSSLGEAMTPLALPKFNIYCPYNVFRSLEEKKRVEGMMGKKRG